MPYVDRLGRTCGFMDLEDQGQNGRFFRRYFMIDQEKGLFLWYMDNPSNLPDGTTQVGEIQLSLISNARDATKQRPKVQFCFVVTIPSQNYYFKADNQQDLDEWVLSLNKACRITVPVSEPSKVAAPLKLDIAKANSQINSSPKSPFRGLSYTTEIVGGVVHQKAVENQSLMASQQTFLDRFSHHAKPKIYRTQQSSIKWKFYVPRRVYLELKKRSSEKRVSQQTLPTAANLAQLNTTQCGHSDTDSEDENAGIRSRSLPRSVSPTGGSERSLTRVFPGRNVIKSGWCVKQGAVRKNWKRRFFILDDQGLAYYKSSTDKLPLKTILKKDITVCKMSEVGGSLQRDNLFEIVSPSRTFYIQAYSPDDMAEWINSINEVRGPKRASAPQASLKLKLSSKSLEFKRDLSDEAKTKTPRTAQGSGIAVKYMKSPNIEIRVDRPPEDEHEELVWEKGPIRAEEESRRSGTSEVILAFVTGPETSL